MRKTVLAGISISLLAVMMFTACGDTQTNSKGRNSVSASSVHMNLENSSDDTTSVLSESSSSAITSSKKITSSERMVSSMSNEMLSSYLLTKRESIPNGTSLKITASKMLKANQQPDYYQKGNFTMVVMKNEKDLTTFKNTINNDAHNYDRYSKDFFEANTLMAVFIPHLSGSIKAQVKSLIQTEDEICIVVTVLTPANHIATDDVNYRFILIETSKDNLLGVKKFEYYKETQAY